MSRLRYPTAEGDWVDIDLTGFPGYPGPEGDPAPPGPESFFNYAEFTAQVAVTDNVWAAIEPMVITDRSINPCCEPKGSDGTVAFTRAGVYIACVSVDTISAYPTERAGSNGLVQCYTGTLGEDDLVVVAQGNLADQQRYVSTLGTGRAEAEDELTFRAIFFVAAPQTVTARIRVWMEQ